MKRFKDILVVYDGREAGQSALERALDLARRNQAKVTVVQVIEHIPRDYRMLIVSLLPEEIKELAVQEHTMLLEKYVASYAEAGEIQLKVVVGQEFIEIIKEVQRNNHDLVIKTARGMGGTIEMLFGSTAMHLLRKCPCPVWLLKPEQGPSFGRIMAAVDVDPAMGEEGDLNNKIMEMATSLAQIEHSDLYVVHAWSKPDIEYLTEELDALPCDIETLDREAKNMHLRWLHDFLVPYDHCYTEHLVEGLAAEVISEFADLQQVDLIVMGTVCRTGIPGFFIGNTAEKIVHRIDCSVLALKPDNFVSPVLLDDEKS